MDGILQELESRTSLLLSDGVSWMLVGQSQVSKSFESKEQLIGEVLRSFVARFS